MAKWRTFFVARRPVAAVFVGGILGGGARAAVSAVFGGGRPIPWSTLLANVSGALLLGFLVTRFLRSPRRHPMTVPLLGTGLLGSYTTFSGFSLEVWDLLDSGEVAAAVGYGLSSVVLGLAAAVLGMRLGERVT